MKLLKLLTPFGNIASLKCLRAPRHELILFHQRGGTVAIRPDRLQAAAVCGNVPQKEKNMKTEMSGLQRTLLSVMVVSILGAVLGGLGWFDGVRELGIFSLICWTIVIFSLHMSLRIGRKPKNTWLAQVHRLKQHYAVLLLLSAWAIGLTLHAPSQFIWTAWSMLGLWAVFLGMYGVARILNLRRDAQNHRAHAESLMEEVADLRRKLQTWVAPEKHQELKGEFEFERRLLEQERRRADDLEERMRQIFFVARDTLIDAANWTFVRDVRQEPMSNPELVEWRNRIMVALLRIVLRHERTCNGVRMSLRGGQLNKKLLRLTILRIVEKSCWPETTVPITPDERHVLFELLPIENEEPALDPSDPCAG